MQPRNPSQYSTNPHTGLPEFGFGSFISRAVRGVTNAVGLTSSGGGGGSAAPSVGGSTTAGATAGTTVTPAPSRGNLKPREWFDDPNAVSYLSRYQDVAADPVFSQNPYLHYTQYGKAEGKTWGGTGDTVQSPASKAAAVQASAAPAANSTTAGSQATGQEAGGAGGAGTPSYPTSQYMGASAKAAAAAAVAGPYDQQSTPKTEEAIQQAAVEEQQGAVKFVTPFTYVDEYGNLNSKELETPFSDAASNARRGQWGSTVQV